MSCTPSAMSITQGLPASFEVRGVSIPAIGIGSFQGDDGNSRVRESCSRLYRRAIDTLTLLQLTGMRGRSEKQPRRAASHARRFLLLPSCRILLFSRGSICRCNVDILFRAQPWHDSSDVESALDQSLNALQLNYGKSFFHGDKKYLRVR